VVGAGEAHLSGSPSIAQDVGAAPRTRTGRQDGGAPARTVDKSRFEARRGHLWHKVVGGFGAAAGPLNDTGVL